MKKIWIALGTACLVIVGCLLYMVRKGIVLRSAPIITPSVLDEDRSAASTAVFHRLFPEFQGSSYVVWGVLPETEESRTFVNLIRLEYEKTFPRKISVLLDATHATEKELKACAEPCWLFVSRTEANELESHQLTTQRLPALSKPFVNLSLIEFSPGITVPEDCLHEKRLSLRCLIPLSIHESERKMRDTSRRYFFLRKYNERDFFLFVQK